MAICCSVRSVLHSVNFDSDIDLYPYFKTKKYSKYIPDFGVSQSAAPTEFTVVYRNSQEGTIEFCGSTIRVNYPWDKMREGESILYLGYPLIEAQNQSMGSSTLHSAAFTVGDRGILLLGDAGCGKTSVVMHACKNAEARLISNDLTIVGLSGRDIVAYGGTKFFHIRKAAVDQNMPWLANLFTEESIVDPWIDKVYVTASDLNVPVCEKPSVLSHIYRIHVDNRMGSVVYRPLKGLQIKLFLNEQLSRFIRNVTTAVMVGPEYEIVAPIPSLDNEERFEKRMNLLGAMIEDVGVTYLSGPLGLVAEHILNKL